ncbi:uncharacterized protein E5676_scaffold808G00790 [Cucumis melo var. makuwa]|uniref:Uncharacterized protein n=1 Tax=Cucumis melo var. makuwa TaxID=1194695 RepID=A0A5D3BS42_CUCMM|nr:uncharacterized protein E6C27_scaffold277G001030 [Cucumis melo var. makuwa]TYK01974.1 uncharacterized protein E5676_scaffold808G00790 [Cucumis melo var. makuwa]
MFLFVCVSIFLTTTKLSFNDISNRNIVSSPSAIHRSQTLAVVSLRHPPLTALRPQPYTIFGRRITRTIQPIVAVFSLHHPPLAFDFRPPNHSNNPTARRRPPSSPSYHLVCLLNYRPPSSSSKRFLPSFSEVIPSSAY